MSSDVAGIPQEVQAVLNRYQIKAYQEQATSARRRAHELSGGNFILLHIWYLPYRVQNEAEAVRVATLALNKAGFKVIRDNGGKSLSTAGRPDLYAVDLADQTHIRVEIKTRNDSLLMSQIEWARGFSLRTPTIIAVFSDPQEADQ